MQKLCKFIDIYRMYRAHHSRAYAARIAYGCAVQGVPF